MKIKFVFLAMLATGFVTSCSNEEVLETNASPTGEAITFRPSVKSGTRATPTTINNLGSFNVYAKGIYSGGALHSSFIIGNNNKPDIAYKSDANDIWKLNQDIYWPSDVSKAIFWAFTDRKTTDAAPTDGNCVAATISFNNNNGPELTNYTPNKAALETAAIENAWTDGYSQRDLVSAFTCQEKNPYVNLKFQHLLSQIAITAQSNRTSTDEHNTRVMTIKGAWLVNVAEKGNLTAGFTYNPNTPTVEPKDNPTWTSNGSTQYGTYYNENAKVPGVTKDSDTPLNILGASGNLMLIPQQINQWNGTEATTNGAYILLLCRVELVHNGTVIADKDYPTYEDTNTGKHYHQLFPIKKIADSSIDGGYKSVFDKDSYGLAAIPVPVDWKMGKKYTYVLDVCGDNSGAGVYPPNVPTEKDELEKYFEEIIPGGDYNYNINGGQEANGTVDIITQIPEGKKVGDNVLTEPIQFKVEVTPWTEADGDDWPWHNGNKSNQ